VHGVPNPVIGGLCPPPGLPAPPPMSIVISVFVCLSFREHISRTTRPIFTKFLYVFPWPWLGPPLAALRYVAYFRFLDGVIFAHYGNGLRRRPIHKVTQQLARSLHRGVSSN